jgi:chromosome segregation ATPase
MSRPTAILASGIFTLFLLAAIGLAVVWNTSASTTISVTDNTTLQTAGDQQAAYQASIEQAQTAMAKREEQYQARLAELERLAEEREAEYQARLAQTDTQIGTYQTQIEQIVQGTAAYQAQLAEMEQALQERYTLFETRRQEFEVQRQERLGQLQAQLAEGKTNLQEANAQLGR